MFQEQVPGLYYFLGVTPRRQPLESAAPNHSPLFYVDEESLTLGVRSLTHLVFDYASPQRD